MDQEQLNLPKELCDVYTDLSSSFSFLIRGVVFARAIGVEDGRGQGVVESCKLRILLKKRIFKRGKHDAVCISFLLILPKAPIACHRAVDINSRGVLVSGGTMSRGHVIGPAFRSSTFCWACRGSHPCRPRRRKFGRHWNELHSASSERASNSQQIVTTASELASYLVHHS